MPTITRDNAARIYALNIGTPEAIASLRAMGFEINTLADQYRLMSEAHDLLTQAELRHQQQHDRARLNYIASATKVPGAQPKFAPWFDEPAVR